MNHKKQVIAISSSEALSAGESSKNSGEPAPKEFLSSKIRSIPVIIPKNQIGGDS